ncbi:MAG: WD40 repeat domain-containing protein [Gemmataceae bacterium]
MRLRVPRFFLALFGCSLLSAQAPAQDAAKRPIPSPSDQARAMQLIDELFKEDLARLKKEPEFAAALALRFLEEGRETRDYPAGRYALLSDARRLAASAGDGATALAAIEELAQSFVLPPRAALEMKIAALKDASKGATTPPGYQALIDTSLVLLEDAIAADDYTAAKGLLDAAGGAARKLRNVPLVSALRKREQEVADMEKRFARWKPFAAALEKDPADPAANLEMGKYQALVKGDWERGLPLLARCKEGPFAEAAKLDLADPRSGEKQKEVAALWLKLSDGLDESMRFHALLRGYQWYLQALGDLDGSERKNVEKTLTKILKLLPPEYQVGEITGQVRKCEGLVGPMYAVSFSPDGRKLAAAGADGAVHVFDSRTGKEQRRLDGGPARIWTVCFAPDNRRVLSGGFDDAIHIWDLISGREAGKLQGHTDYVRSVVVSRDGRLALSGGDDRLLRLWNLETRREERVFPGHDHFIWRVDLSRDGKRALSASLDKTIRLWNVETGKTIKTLTGHADTVLSVVFSPDGRRALSGSTDKTLKLWDLDTGECLKTFTGHKGYVHCVAFSPDGRRALSASADRTLKLWDVHEGMEIRTLEGHGDQVWFVTFSRDGRFAASAGQDGTVRIWGHK